MSPGRNDPCPCRSGKKYKKCCEEKDQARQRAQLEKQWKAAEVTLAKAQQAEAEKASAASPAGPAGSPPARKPEPRRNAPPSKHNTFVTPKYNMPRKAGGG
jgi:hypothetical protein